MQRKAQRKAWISAHAKGSMVPNQILRVHRELKHLEEPWNEAIAARDIDSIAKLAAANAKLREQLFRLAGVPTPPRGRQESPRKRPPIAIGGQVISDAAVLPETGQTTEQTTEQPVSAPNAKPTPPPKPKVQT